MHRTGGRNSHGIKDKRIRIIVGHYGSGKTEFAVNYAVKMASWARRRPLWIWTLQIHISAGASGHAGGKGVSVYVLQLDTTSPPIFHIFPQESGRL